MPKEKSCLLSSAKEFLIEAISYCGKGKLNFAIVHAVTATELALKERLYRINPILIYRNIDTTNIRKEHSINLQSIPSRLTNLGLSLPEGEVRLIETFANWRNQIVHHMPGFDRRSAQKQLPLLLDTLSKILRRDLSTPLESFLPKRLYKIADKILKDWETVVQRARAVANKTGLALKDNCPKCGSSFVMSADQSGAIFCHLCKDSSYYYGKCPSCNRKVPIYAGFMGENSYCDQCLDALAEQHYQMEADIQMGK